MGLEDVGQCVRWHQTRGSQYVLSLVRLVVTQQACTALELVVAQKGGRRGGGGFCWPGGGTGVRGQLGWGGAGCRWELRCGEGVQDPSVLCPRPLRHRRQPALPPACPLPADAAGGAGWGPGVLPNPPARF